MRISNLRPFLTRAAFSVIATGLWKHSVPSSFSSKIRDLLVFPHYHDDNNKTYRTPVSNAILKNISYNNWHRITYTHPHRNGYPKSTQSIFHKLSPNLPRTQPETNRRRRGTLWRLSISRESCHLYNLT